MAQFSYFHGSNKTLRFFGLGLDVRNKMVQLATGSSKDPKVFLVSDIIDLSSYSVGRSEDATYFLVLTIRDFENPRCEVFFTDEDVRDVWGSRIKLAMHCLC